ncbi:MAG: ribonuclease III, partial [Candidatus Pacebacteria bacterium]|nr:ribonuclease III [Candidatus Paceibacterota bacterium]
MKISNLENIISYTFKDKTILNKALTHSSFSNEHKTESYEKLEFLGDAVL